MNTSHDLPGQPSEQPIGPDAPPPLQPSGAAKFFQWIRGLGIRRGTNRWVGGVCSGLGEKWGIDPVIVRGVTVVLTLFFGIGLLAYGIAWALLPEPDGRIHVEEVGRGHWSAGMTGAAIATMLGLGGSGRDAFGANDGWSFWPVIWMGGAAWVIYWAYNHYKAKDNPDNPKQTGEGLWQGGQPNRPGQNEESAEAPASVTPQSKAPYQPAGYPGAWQVSGAQHTPAPQYGYSFTPNPGNYVKVRPVRSTPRLGAAASLVVMGAAAVVGAVILLLSANNVIDLNGHGTAVAVAAAAITAGLGILAAGIAGRTAGGLGTFAIIGLVVAGGLSLPQQDVSAFKDANWAPTTISAAQTGRTILMGNGTVDLTKFDGGTTLTKDVQIPLNLVASNVTIQVPDNIPVQFQSELAAASLTIDGKTTGSGVVEKTTSNINPKTSGPGLVITLQGAATNIEVQVVPAP